MKKFNLKLTAFLVSFFIGLLLLILGPVDFTPIIGFVIYEAALQFLALYIIPMVA